MANASGTGSPVIASIAVLVSDFFLTKLIMVFT